MWIPTSFYEALPAIYFAIGAAIAFFALYIGIGHQLMLGYLMLGSGCMMAGVFVKSMRMNARTGKERPTA